MEEESMSLYWVYTYVTLIIHIHIHKWENEEALSYGSLYLINME